MSDEIHPLDREDDFEPAPSAVEQTTDGRILKILVVVAVLAGAVACIASAAAANLTYQSTPERIASALRTIGCIVALIACAGMIVVYRMRGMLKARKRASEDAIYMPSGKASNFKYSQSSLSAMLGAEQLNPETQEFAAAATYQPDDFDLGIRWVFTIVGISIAVNWACAILSFALSLAVLLAHVVSLIELLVAINMIVFNTGVSRAFGIGWLAVGLVKHFGLFSFFSMGFGSVAFNQMSTQWYVGLLPAVSSTVGVLIAGLSATYVWAILRRVAWKRQQRLLRAQHAAAAARAPSELDLG